jgi:hypothetical protein
MKSYQLLKTDNGLRLQPAQLRAMGDEHFTWAHLLYGNLGNVKVGIYYFPSRFDTETDSYVMKTLQAFGKNSGHATSVNFWDTTDPEFELSLELFSIKTLPAIVLATGLKVEGLEPRGPEKTPLYSIILDRPAVLSDLENLQSAINSAHEILVRSDPKEIASYIKKQTASSILSVIGAIAVRLRDEILKWKPKFGLPGGVSVQVG